MALIESSASSAFTPEVFSNPIADKLDKESFSPWQQLALASIKGQNLEDHLEKEKILEKYTSKDDKTLGTESKRFQEWQQQDYSLMSWLLSSMDTSFKNRMVGCSYACKI